MQQFRNDISMLKKKKSFSIFLIVAKVKNDAFDTHIVLWSEMIQFNRVWTINGTTFIWWMKRKIDLFGSCEHQRHRTVGEQRFNSLSLQNPIFYLALDGKGDILIFNMNLFYGIRLCRLYRINISLHERTAWNRLNRF